jgi:hypothetical protein
MTNKERATLLRSAASALEHGRLSTAQKKLRQAAGTPYVMVTVRGGVADVAMNGGAEVDILDFDNLEASEAAHEGVTLSDREREFLRTDDPELYAALYPAGHDVKLALHRAVTSGPCDVCGHHGDDCTGVRP